MKFEIFINISCLILGVWTLAVSWRRLNPAANFDNKAALVAAIHFPEAGSEFSRSLENGSPALAGDDEPRGEHCFLRRQVRLVLGNQRLRAQPCRRRAGRQQRAGEDQAGIVPAHRRLCGAVIAAHWEWAEPGAPDLRRCKASR